MAETKSNAFTATTPEARLERLISTCRLMQQNLNHLIGTLAVVDDAIPDRENRGIALSGLINMMIAHQNNEYADFVSEIALAAGEAA
ncbi:hypothetical protein [Bombella mellum]|uniref:Uncharacterized protein n=1 Tax=Bombella mellum TaxID=2039288 RepID=A0ABR5ZRT0_9PROT|nr:hypothetical protein [Bombella mellum]MBA5726894.1 hypothetical protein [Bombella mellum]